VEAVDEIAASTSLFIGQFYGSSLLDYLSFSDQRILVKNKGKDDLYYFELNSGTFRILNCVFL